MAHTTAGQHVQPAMSSGSGKPAVEFRFNPDTRRWRSTGQPVHLTQREYQVLELLWVHKGQTLTKQMILNHLYGGTYEPGQKVIDVFICRIRKKLRATIGNDYIETAWGRGYMLPDPNP